MDDFLQILFHSSDNIESVAHMEHFNIILALLSSYLLELTREKRIEIRIFVFSINATYFCDYLQFLWRKTKQKQKLGKSRHITLLDPIWCKKYISLTILLVKALIDQFLWAHLDGTLLLSFMVYFKVYAIIMIQHYSFWSQLKKPFYWRSFKEKMLML